MIAGTEQAIAKTIEGMLWVYGPAVALLIIILLAGIVALWREVKDRDKIIAAKDGAIVDLNLKLNAEVKSSINLINEHKEAYERYIEREDARRRR